MTMSIKDGNVYLNGALHQNCKVARVAPKLEDYYVDIYGVDINRTWPWRLDKGTLIVIQSPSYFNEPTVLKILRDSSLTPGRHYLECIRLPIYKKESEEWFKHQVLITNFKTAKERCLCQNHKQ